MSKKEKLKIIPLGGLGEVGKNMTAYEYGGDILIVDAGIMFPENDMLGVDYIIPDFEYLLDKADRVRGIVITHGHEDHIGAVRHVLEQIPVPVFSTPLALGLIEGKLARGGMANKADLRRLKAGEKVQIGKFTVETFHICHSIPDSIGLGITTGAGLVVHMSDFKLDQTPVDGWPTDYAKLAEFSQRGVELLLSDSTNSERAGWTPSEKIIGPAFDQVMASAPGRVIVATFASLISRIQQVADSAVRNRRKMAFAGTSMVENVKIARNLGYLKAPDETFVPIDQALHLPDNKVVIMCTGSQGEPSSIIGRLSTGSNRQFDVKRGDTIVLSSHPIPGNEEPVSRAINRLLRLGAEVIYDAIAPVHVSGHASQEEQKFLLNLVRPKNFLPIHGELRQLRRHAWLAEQMGIPKENIAVVENGQTVELADGKLRLGERIPGGYIFVDGESIGDIDHDVMKEREQLARNGIVIIDLSLDKVRGRLVHEPEVVTRGFLSPEDAEQLIPEIRKRVAKAIRSGGVETDKEIAAIVKNYLYEQTRRKPLVFVTMSKA
ncbi:MAG: ribonuclease J [Anaerolineae bacterium CFX3]|jgi:ribonuclease J|nr:Ribonuclease J1 [Anaerolineales bacterium]MCE7905233.1 ribonuclease J [Anaerolineae bacterium CFX3]MCQ3946574.1 ribonuclease J [Anaerolineae bacterium]OQY82858.1 MAG: ribonuclease J [Anaerolineae bacterium UTCFX3]GER81352.1 ribonuclease J [Candidatus Denitrolinea symbiosum]